MRKSAAVAVLALALLTAAKRRVVAPSLGFDARRSFVVTDQVILQNFTFQRVLDQLVACSGVGGLTAAQLYRQWFDTQNPRPGLFDATAPHCDDFTTGGQPSFNGIPRRCPTPEGALAASPFAADEYFPLALVNRFDLSPPDGANCGQYRMIFARRNTTRTQKLHIIFEAVLPNPHPESGLGGCREAALFWANLSGIASPFERRTLLEQFFFDGAAGYGPVVDPSNYSGSTGQSGIRTLHFGAGSAAPRFYQFRLTKSCSGNDCNLRMMPDVLENLPFGDYFDGHNTTDVARAFRQAFVGQVASLAVNDINLFDMTIPREFLMAESDPIDGRLAFDFNGAFSRGLTTPDGADFKAKLDAELQRAGSGLTAQGLIVRATLHECNGCHVGNPDKQTDPTAGFGLGIGNLQHLDEALTEPGDGGPRFRISDAMAQTFVPHRMDILRDYLSSGKAPVHSN